MRAIERAAIRGPKGNAQRGASRSCCTRPAPSVYFLVLSASAASFASGTAPPRAWVMLISDSVRPTKTSSMTPYAFASSALMK